MHELGVVIEVVKTVEAFARENHVTRIESVVLQIGEFSSMIPKYIEDCWPAAVDGTFLGTTGLRIEILPANALCGSCRKVFHLTADTGGCPHCNGKHWEVLGGREFMIKEIVAC